MAKSSDQQVEDDLNLLLNACLSWANVSLEKNGDLSSCAFEVMEDGNARFVDFLESVDSLIGQLIDGRDYSRATAVAFATTLAETGQRAIRVLVEHRDGPSLCFDFPILSAEVGNPPKTGDPVITEAERQVWSD